MAPIRRLAWLAALSGIALAAPARAQDAPPTAAANQPAAVPNNSKPKDAAAAAADPTVVLEERLLDRQPFDRVTLKSDNAVLETVLLDLPERRVPDPLPTTGALELRRLSQPSIPYQAQWDAVAKIELFEQILLAEATRLTGAGAFGDAFEYLAYLSSNYPQLAGLEAARQEHLWREASAAYAGGKRDEAWPGLLALYERNPEFPRLASAVQAVSDDLISRKLTDKNYAAAGALLDSLAKGFPKLQLANVATWRERFQTDAAAQLVKAREALAAKDYSAARSAVNHARSILPTIAGGDELWREIQESSPEIRVGVTQAGIPSPPMQTPDWAAARTGDLVDPRLVELDDFSAEGGVYASRWGEILNSDSGVETTIRLSPQALSRGVSPDAVALQLVDTAAAASQYRQEGLAGLLAGLQTFDGRDVKITWRRPHVRPETFLQLPLRWLTTAGRSPGLWFESPPIEAASKEIRYTRNGPTSAAGGAPSYVVETLFDDDEAAIAALLNGDVDAIDRVPPWQLASLRQASSVVVAPYRMPTVHVLVPNPKNALLATREFRRALAYGIDNESIVSDILLAGQAQPGFRTLSGPFVAGVGLNDPTAYGYDATIQSRPYEPRLAALLAGVARTTLAKRDAALAKEREDAKKAAEKAKDAAAKDGAKDDGDGKPAEPVVEEKPAAAPPAEQKLPPPPLVLAYPPDPLARLACQSIKIQLDGVGIPIKLFELPAGQPWAEAKWDLMYLELAAWEPIYDARRLLGPGGVAGESSALMSLALDELERAENWNQARAQLKEIHRIAHYDLPLLPLWQTVNHFAYRKNVAGVGASPVRLYQNLAAWRKTSQ